jgi:hypothetical protein
VLIRDKKVHLEIFLRSLNLKPNGSTLICAKWLFMEIEVLQGAEDQLVGGSEEEEDLQVALADEVEEEAVYEVEEGNPYLTVLESPKRKRSK